MPKVAGRVLKTKIVDGAMLMKAQLSGKLPPEGSAIYVKWGSLRSRDQNALLWAYYTWLIDFGGLKEHGFYCPEAIHESLKAKFLADKIMSKGEWKAIEDGSTATLSKSEFSEYIEKIDHFICDFFQADTSPFWEAHKSDEETMDEEVKKAMKEE